MKKLLLFLILPVFLLINCNGRPSKTDNSAFIVPCDIYKTEILFVIESDSKAARDIISKVLDDTTIIEEDFIGNDGMTFTPQSGYIVVWLERKPQTLIQTAILTHELLHVTISILNRVGVSVSDSSEEAYTYLIQYLTEEFYKHI